MPAHSPPQNPLIAIIGATGTGKSQLAVELALRFNGEVINDDAMQLYEGMPIITNKIPVEERKGVRHHLLGVVPLKDEPWRVGRFVREALGVIREIRSRGRIPILVGGTHYYTQSLLFQDTLAQEAEESDNQNRAWSGEEKELGAKGGGAIWPILEGPTEDMLDRLREVDPIMADRWHPNDRRKIRRSLEIWLQTGIPASQVYEEQRKNGHSGDESGDSPDPAYSSEGPTVRTRHPVLRFQTLFFWNHAPHPVLSKRLDARVDKMMQDGLLTEIQTLGTYLRDRNSESMGIDRTRGIWVSIGFKEFEQYYNAVQAGLCDAGELQKLESEAIENTKTATRHYAKTQVRWIRIKLLHALRAADMHNNLFLLDISDISHWHSTVLEPAFHVAEKFLKGAQLPESSALNPTAGEFLAPKTAFDLSDRRDKWVRKTCNACGMTATTDKDWEQHVRSRRHRNTVRAEAKRGRAENEQTACPASGSANQRTAGLAQDNGQVVQVH